jgi:voltage-gated potassium channel
MATEQSTMSSTHPEKGKFFYLFLAQVLLLVLFPYMDKSGLPTVLFRLLGAAAFLSGVYAVSSKRAQWITALILAVSVGTLHTMFAFRPDPKLVVPMLICTIAFLAFTLVSLLRAVILADGVTRDTIYGALSVYLLMATTWGAAYLLLETLQPGALAIDLVRHPNHRMDWFDCIFYSYATLTTLGYGDIVPVTAQARSLSILEAVSGVLYVAVLIARLVGVYSAAKFQTNPQAAGLDTNPERVKEQTV